MTEAEVEQVLLKTIRKYMLNESLTTESTFDTDMKLSPPARQMMFAAVAEAFNARGVSLPSHDFFQRDFVACATPGAVRDAIRAKVFGGSAARARASHAAAEKSAAHAPAAATSSQEASAASSTAAEPAASTEATAEGAAAPAASDTATPEAEAGGKKKTGAAKKKPAAKKSTKPIRRRPN